MSFDSFKLLGHKYGHVLRGLGTHGEAIPLRFPLCHSGLGGFVRAVLVPSLFGLFRAFTALSLCNLWAEGGLGFRGESIPREYCFGNGPIEKRRP